MTSSPELLPLSECVTQAYIGNTLQMADVLEWCARQIGRCRVTVSSFSVSEEFLRRLWSIRKKQQIESVAIVLDSKATRKTVNLWLFLSRVAEAVYLAENHSKVMIVEPVEVEG